MTLLRSFADFEAFIATFTNYERRRKFNFDPETVPLSRMRDFLKELSDPHFARPCIHVTGSKGKGSTTYMIEALLSAEGFGVGTYTSPHLEHVCERIRVRGESIPAERLVELTNRILPVLENRRLEPHRFPTFFELMTGLAMLWFAEQPVDWAIYEVGLGGRLDATNVVEPRVAVITSIGYEHTQVLGDTLAKIAHEKGGIIKHRVPVICGALPDEAREEIARICDARSAPMVEVAADVVRPLGTGRILIPDAPDVLAAPSIRGPALRANLAIALEASRRALTSIGRSLSWKAVATALDRLWLPGRLELFPGPPVVLIDGAHTAESFDALERSLEEIGIPRPVTAVFSLSSDKNVEPILATLRRLADRFIFTRADAVRSFDPAWLRDTLGEGEMVDDPERAVREALKSGTNVIVCGSMYLAGNARRVLAREFPGIFASANTPGRGAERRTELTVPQP
jgi:dihydrofolate synthase/folylpolyglutamate synthase